MKNNYIIFVLLFFTANQIYSQVGINTSTPNGPLDIRVSEGINQSGLVVTDEGTMIIGKSTSTTENAKLVIEGQMKIKTGSEASNKYYLTNDAGVTDWQTLTLGSEYTIWRLANPAYTFTTTPNRPLTGTSSFVENELNMTLATNTVYIPKGKYLIICYGDVTGVEFGELSLYRLDNSQDIVRISYYGYLPGTTTYIDMPDTVQAGLRFTTYSASQHVWQMPYTENYTYELTFLRLSE